MNRIIMNFSKNKLFLISFVLIFVIFILYIAYFKLLDLPNIFSTGFFIKDFYKNETSQDILQENITKEVLGRKLVTKVIDGDTIIIEGGYIVRLSGIDADEINYPCYEDAKKRLEELILNKEVEIEAGTKDKDEYQRYLRYLILNKENINVKLVREGLAIARFYLPNEKYREEISNAERYARENKIGCKWAERTSTTNVSKIGITASLPTTIKINISTIPSTIKYNKEESEQKTINKEIEACDAINYIGEEKIVVGKVVSTFRSGTNTVFLNFEKPYPNHCFVAVIFSSYLKNFPKNPEKYYYGKILRIKGKIEEYEGKPQIILKNSSQIEIAE